MSGLRQKYVVTRADGEERPDAFYFVLDLAHDAAARRAVQAYADEIRESNPLLASDLRRWDF